MDQEKIKTLIEAAGQEDQIKLKVLHNAVIKCIQDYRTESTSSRLNDWQKAETALDAFDGVEMASVRAQSLSLTQLFADLLIQRVPEAQIVTPMTDARGSQVSFTHPHAYALVQALVARGVIGDYREPGLARFGFAPLYVRHVDVWDAVDQLVEVLQSGEHLDPTYAARNAVT